MKKSYQNKSQVHGVVLNLVSLLFSSVSPVLNKFSLTSLSPVIGGFFTSVFAGIFAFLLAFFRQEKPHFKALSNQWVWLLGGTNAVGIILQYIALSKLSPITVTLIARMYLVYVFLLSFIFLKEKITLPDFFAIILCIIGSFLISGGRIALSDNVIGIICAFIYPLMYAANNITAKFLIKGQHPTTILFYNHITSAIILLLYALISRASWNSITSSALAFNFGGAFFNGFLSLLLFFTSLQFISAGKANIVRALGPVIVIIYSAFFFPVKITPSLVTGTLLVAAASVIVTFTQTRKAE